MNREAVALGTPVFTTFEGRLGAVDEQLLREGRLRKLEDPGQVQAREAPAARVRPDPPRSARIGETAALGHRTVTNRITSSVNARRLGQVGVDACLIALAYYLAFVLRFDAGIPDRYEDLLVGHGRCSWCRSSSRCSPPSASTRSCGGSSTRRTSSRSSRPSWSSSFVLIGLLFLLTPTDADPPRGVIALDFLLTLALVAGARFLVRAAVERPLRQPLVQRADNEVLIVGAGNGGQQVALELRRNPELSSAVIGFIDDDPRKQGMLVSGHRVHGTTDDLPRVLDDTKPDEVVIAIPSAPGRAAAQGGHRVPRARHPRAHAAHRVRAALARRRTCCARCARCRSRTSSAASRCGWRSIAWAPTCAGAWCWSRARAARSARSCAARSRGVQAQAAGARRPRREQPVRDPPPARGGAPLRRARRAVLGRLQGRHPHARAVRRGEALGGLPRGRLQARGADGGEPRRGGAQQRRGHADRRGRRGRGGRGAVRARVHRQGGDARPP